MAKVTIYTKTGCPYCGAAKKFYADKRTAFDEINITEKPQYQAKVLELTGGQKTVPVIVGDGEIKVGFGGG